VLNVLVQSLKEDIPSSISTHWIFPVPGSPSVGMEGLFTGDIKGKLVNREFVIS